MSEEEKKTLQEEAVEEENGVKETEAVEAQEAQTAEQEEETSADTTNVEKENESVQNDEQNTVTSEPSTEGSAGGETAESDEAEATEEAEEEKNNKDMSFGDYIDNIPQIRKGAIVKGVPVRYDDEYVYVDVRDKSEGKVPLREFKKDPNFDLDEAIKNKEPFEVYVKDIRYTDEGKDIQLSKSRVDFTKNKAKAKEAYENEEPVIVTPYRQVKDGLICSFGSVDVYLHRTQIENRTLSNDEMSEYLNEDIEILITQFDDNRRRLRVSGSRRTLINKIRKEQAEELWDNIAVGDIYEGVVRNITNFGAFVDIGGVDGLVHISELSWQHVDHPSDVVSVGDVIQVYVKDFDRERNRISLGYKKIEDDPYRNVEEKFPVGSVVTGTVVRIVNFGAFVEIAPGVDALCHISEISDIHLDSPADVLEVGQEVTAKVLAVSNEKRRVSISIRAYEPMNELRGEAKEKYEKRQAEKAKRNANRPPKSYHDSGARRSSGPSDMEKAFAAAKAEKDEEAAAEEAKDTEEEDSEVEETPEVEKTPEETQTEESSETEEDTETAEEKLSLFTARLENI